MTASLIGPTTACYMHTGERSPGVVGLPYRLDKYWEFYGTSLWGDITFFDGNAQYTLAGLNTAFGTLNVMRVYVSLDSGWSGNSQILDIDNFTVNNDVYRASSVPNPLPCCFSASA